MHGSGKKPSAEINVQAFVSFEEAGNPFEDDGGCLFVMDSKVIVVAAVMTAVSLVITSGIQQYNSFVEERLQKRTKSIKKPLRKNKLHVFVQQRKAQKSSLTILRNGCSLFSRLYIACQTRKGDLPEFFRHENQQRPASLSKLDDKRTGKKADLQKCLEHSPLGSGNADEEEVLVDEINNTDYEETVDPVADDIATEELSDFISGTELEPCKQEEEQLISKKTLRHTLLQTAHLKQM